MKTTKRIPTVDEALNRLAENQKEAAAFDAATAKEFPQARNRREAVVHALKILHAKQGAMNSATATKAKNATVKRAVESITNTIRAQYQAMKPGAERSAFRKTNWQKLLK